MPDSMTTIVAAAAEYDINLTATTTTATACTSGITSNAFGVRDNQGIVLLSLPPEGLFSLFDILRSAACKHTELAR